MHYIPNLQAQEAAAAAYPSLPSLRLQPTPASRYPVSSPASTLRGWQDTEQNTFTQQIDDGISKGEGYEDEVAQTQVSSKIGGVGTDELSGLQRDQPSFTFQEVGQGYKNYSDSKYDSRHLESDVMGADFDGRSAETDMTSEGDDKSMYEEPQVGAIEGTLH